MFQTAFEKGRLAEDVAGLTEDHCRVDLAVSVGGAVALALLHEVLRGHCYHDRLLLQSVNVLHHSPSHQVLPTEAHTHTHTHTHTYTQRRSTYAYLQANINETAMHRQIKQSATPRKPLSYIIAKCSSASRLSSANSELSPAQGSVTSQSFINLMFVCS